MYIEICWYRGQKKVRSLVQKQKQARSCRPISSVCYHEIKKKQYFCGPRELHLVEGVRRGGGGEGVFCLQ